MRRWCCVFLNGRRLTPDMHIVLVPSDASIAGGDRRRCHSRAGLSRLKCSVLRRGPEVSGTTLWERPTRVLPRVCRAGPGRTLGVGHCRAQPDCAVGALPGTAGPCQWGTAGHSRIVLGHDAAGQAGLWVSGTAGRGRDGCVFNRDDDPGEGGWLGADRRQCGGRGVRARVRFKGGEPWLRLGARSRETGREGTRWLGGWLRGRSRFG